MVEHLKHSLHKLILRGYELLHLRVVVGIVGLVIAGLAVALIVPHVHHLSDFLEERYKFSRIRSKPQLYAVIFINLYLKDEVMDKVLKHPVTHIDQS
jgi:mannitol-specific phosphotransferase system IIBC component